MAQWSGQKSESLRPIFFNVVDKEFVFKAQVAISNTFGVWVPTTETMQTIMYMESSAANEMERRKKLAEGR